MKRFIFLILTALLVACKSAPSTESPSSVPPSPTPASIPTLPKITPSGQPEWWEQAVFYEIFVRSFYDSNGDGIGDFNGITQKLDYLENLGISALWLMPIHPSPSYHGYDVINYYNVNPDYGTFTDFQNLIAEAHKRNIRIIIDLVLNHTSDRNPWFVNANNSPQSPYRNWYIWSDTDPGYLGPLGRAWHSGLHGYYYGIFNANMPDLNYTNPAVTAEMEKVVRFWLDNIGVDGFRLDAVKYLVEEGKKQENTQSTHLWLKGFYTSYKADEAEAYTVGEVYSAGAFIAKTYTGNQMDEIFSFELSGGFVNSTLGEANTSVNSAIQFSLKDMPDGPYATFLTNHDQNRIMSVLNGSVEKAKVAAALLLTSPGTPFIYYGEEIGMEGVKPDEMIRTPMQWSSGANAGFTNGTPWEAIGANYLQSNVTDESTNLDSLLSYYHNLISLRIEHPALYGYGIKLISSSNPGVYAVLRTSPNEKIMVIVNLTKAPISDYGLDFKDTILGDGSYQLQSLLDSVSASELNVAGNSFSRFTPLPVLPPYSIYIFLLSQ
jgi:glycosidase